MHNLLDLMSAEDRKIALEMHQKRMSGDTSYRQKSVISPQLYLIAELGYYFGWGAVEAVKRGYVEDFAIKYKDGKRIEERVKIPLTMEEVSALTEAAKKVWYSKVIDSARGTQVATSSAMSKHSKDIFNKGIKPYMENARV